jgi:hypothetical protein
MIEWENTDLIRTRDILFSETTDAGTQTLMPPTGQLSPLARPIGYLAAITFTEQAPTMSDTKGAMIAVIRANTVGSDDLEPKFGIVRPGNDRGLTAIVRLKEDDTPSDFDGQPVLHRISPTGRSIANIHPLTDEGISLGLTGDSITNFTVTTEINGHVTIQDGLKSGPYRQRRAPYGSLFGTNVEYLAPGKDVDRTETEAFYRTAVKRQFNS